MEDVSPTVLRFFVYSDVELERVRATVGEANQQLDGSVARDFYPDAGTNGENLLFSIAVERTGQSADKKRAELSLEGFAGQSADSQIVLRQTVRADFSDRQTRVVRIWLSRACVHESGQQCGEGMSCDGETGGCVVTPELTSSEFDATEDMTRWQPAGDYRACGARGANGHSDGFCPIYCGPAQDSDCDLRPPAAECTDDDQCSSGSCECVDAECAQLRCCAPPCASRMCAADLANDPSNCGSCGLTCEYPRCSEGACTATLVVPPVGSEPFTDTIAQTGVYMRRVVGASLSVAAIGVNSPQVGAKYTVFVASDTPQGEPGTVLASAEVTVQEAASYSDAGRPRGAELVFPSPIAIAKAWIGFSATGTSLVDVSTKPTLTEERTASRVPAVGESFAPGDVFQPDPPLANRPSFYGVFYP